MNRLCCVLAVASLSVAGCDSDPTEEVESDVIYPDVFVTASSPTSASVLAYLRIGGPVSQGYVDLGSGDTITASTGAEAKELNEEEGFLGDTYYVESFSDGSEDALYTFTLELERGDTWADSWVTLPAPYDLSAPAASSTHSRASALTVTWGPSGTSDQMWIEVQGTCLRVTENIFQLSGDGGSHTIPANTLVTADGQEGATCAATVRVTRSRTGTVDEGFERGGSIVGWQVRTVEITTTP